MAQSTSLQLAWLDGNIYSDENKELLKKIREINRDAMEFNEEEECLRFLGRGVGDPRRFIFIVSGALGEKMVPKIEEHQNVLSIYVYCGNRARHVAWSKPYKKVDNYLNNVCFFLCPLLIQVTVVTSAEEVLKGIKSDQDRFR